jgi:hypothetical protein
MTLTRISGAIKLYRLRADKNQWNAIQPRRLFYFAASCGLLRVSDHYAAAHAMGKAHTSLSGHENIKYSLVQAPDRLRDVQAVEPESEKR